MRFNCCYKLLYFTGATRWTWQLLHVVTMTERSGLRCNARVLFCAFTLFDDVLGSVIEMIVTEGVTITIWVFMKQSELENPMHWCGTTNHRIAATTHKLLGAISPSTVVPLYANVKKSASYEVYGFFFHSILRCDLPTGLRFSILLCGATWATKWRACLAAWNVLEIRHPRTWCLSVISSKNEDFWRESRLINLTVWIIC